MEQENYELGVATQITPLTNTQLRAADVAVTLDSEVVAVLGPLTDTELRATEVPVSGPLTDTELRAADVAVTLDSEIVTTDAAATAITFYALTLTLADTEYSQALPATCRRVAIYNRSAHALRLAFETGKVATPTDPYRTIPANSEWDSGPVKLSSATVYLATDDALDVVEIEAHS